MKDPDNKSFMSLFIILAVIGFGTLYWFIKSTFFSDIPNSFLNNEVSVESTTTPINSNDSSKQNQNEDENEDEDEDTTYDNEQEGNDNDTNDNEFIVSIEDLNKEYIRLFSEKYNKKESDVSLKISEYTDRYVKGSLNFMDEPSGAMFFGALVNGEWKIIFDGNGIVPCDVLELVSYPSDMVGECMDENTQVIVKRD